MNAPVREGDGEVCHMSTQPTGMPVFLLLCPPFLCVLRVYFKSEHS